jgi:hypothetical protein
LISGRDITFSLTRYLDGAANPIGYRGTQRLHAACLILLFLKMGTDLYTVLQEDAWESTVVSEHFLLFQITAMGLI